MPRSRLVRLLLITLAFTSVSATLSALPGAALDYWHLYYSPVLIAAMSFGLRGALLGSTATVVSLTILLYRVQLLLFLAADDAVLRLSLLVGAVGPAFRQLIYGLWPLLDATDRLFLAHLAIDTSTEFLLGVLHIGLGVSSMVGGACLVGFHVDRQRLQEARALRESRTDGLTGLTNYRSLMEELDRAVTARPRLRCSWWISTA